MLVPLEGVAGEKGQGQRCHWTGRGDWMRLVYIYRDLVKGGREGGK